MKKKQFRARLRLLLVLTLLLLTLIGYAVGKYMEDKTIDGRVVFTASLADEVILQERTAQRQENGSYKLVSPMCGGNDYVLLPGLDIPKDPHIIIEGKTAIPAFLFVEVVDNTGNDAIAWAVDTALWEPVPDVAGNVYVYKEVLTATPPDPIYILAGNQVTVSQHLNCDGRTTDDALTFRVKLVQKYDGATPKQAYNGYHE